MHASTREHASGATPGRNGTARSGGPPALRWYACYTRGRHEKRVAAQLGERSFEVFLPLVARERRWHDRTKTVEFPLFRSYVFSRFDLRQLHYVLSTPGVATIVRFDGEPAPIEDEEIENVRRLVDAINRSGLDPRPEPLVEIREGERVRVAAGPFRGVEGVVLERRGRDRAMLQVGLQAIGQGLKIEVETRALQPIGRARIEERP